MNEKSSERFIAQNVSLPISLRDRISEEAQKRGLSLSELIRIAVKKEIQEGRIKQEGADGNS